MEVEIEAKFLDVDVAEFRRKLRQFGAELVHPERLMKRRIFDFPDGRLEKNGGWVRLRDEGDSITLSYKQLNDRTLNGTVEITVQVGDFEKTCALLEVIGLEAKSYQETKREKWLLDGGEVTLDTWPWIPSFIEIEAASETQVKALSAKLGLAWSQALHGSVEIAYQHYFAVTEEEIWRWKEITFVPVPQWLEVRRRQALARELK